MFFVDDLVLIDWLSFTSQIHSPQDLISILGMDAASWTPGRGAYGYKDRLYYNCCSIHYNGGPDMGVWVELSGQGCRCFEDIGHGDYTMLFDLIDDNPDQMHLTRLDIAFDDHTGLLDMQDVMEDTRLQNWVGPAASWTVTESNKGSSVVIGSPQSRVLVRIYDKAAERGRTGEHWVRVEMQLRDDRALQFSRLPYSIGEAFAGVLVNYLRYVEPVPTDSNKRRWPLRDYWADLVGRAAAISIFTKPGLQYNVLKCERYVYRQAGNAIDALIKCYGLDQFKEKLDRRQSRPNPKYSQMIEDFLRSCEDAG